MRSTSRMKGKKSMLSPNAAFLSSSQEQTARGSVWCERIHHLISSWKGLNRPPMVAQRGHFLLAPCSAMSTSTHAWQSPQMHSVHAYEFFSLETPWQAAQ